MSLNDDLLYLIPLLQNRENPDDEHKDCAGVLHIKIEMLTSDTVTISTNESSANFIMEAEEIEEKHPIETANIFSRILFCWVYPILSKGQKKELGEDDLYRRPKEDSSQYLGNYLQKEWNNELKGKNPSLLKALIRIFGCKYLLICPLPLIQECFVMLSQAYLIGMVIDYFDGKQEEEFVAYLSAAGICLLAASVAFTLHGFFFRAQRMGMKIRIACCSLLYRKALRLSHSALGQSTIGQMVNLLSNDVNRFDNGLYMFPYLFIGPLQVILAVILLWKFLGYAILAGVSVLVLYTPVQIQFGRLFSKLRLSTAKLADKRLHLLNEVMAGMRVIKMYTWEFAFASLVELARKDEIKQIKKTFFYRGISLAMGFILSKLIVFLSFLTFFFIGGKLTATIAFVTINVTMNLYVSTLTFLPQAINQTAELLISIKRLEKFLLLEEREATNDVKVPKLLLNDCGVWMKNICASWNKDAKPTLQDISLNVQPGDLLAVVGSVGSGKTSLLMSILGEIPIISGEVNIKGKISYASQEAWIFSGSIRENILFGDDYCENKYKEVLRVSALEKDINLFADGDLTVVGERGMAMSGGQKARINLARALYLDADIFIFDDPLSAVDTHVAKHIFERCILEHLNGKIRILATHQIQFLKSATKIIMLKEGKCEAIGSYKELVKMGMDLGINDEEEETKYIKNELNSKSILSVGKEINKYVNNNLSQNCFEISKVSLTSNHQVEKSNKNFKKENQQVSKKFDLTVYREYANAASGVFFQMILLSLFFVSQALVNGSDYWLVQWTKQERNYSYMERINENITVKNSTTNERNCIISLRQFNMYIYSGLVSGTCILFFICAISFFIMSMNASINLHNNMLHSIIRAPISFLDSNPIGKVLNRFSRDMGIVDDQLPSVGFECLSRSLNIIGMFILEAIINPFMLIPTILLLILLYFPMRFFIKVAKNVKHLEGITRSPVFTHLSTSLYGLATIRAFKVERNFEIDFDKYQDKHTSSWLLFLALSRWIGMNIHLLCILDLITVIAGSFFLNTSSLTGGEFGLIITYALIVFNSFQWIVRQDAELESQITSVERILDYSNLSPENKFISPSGHGPPPGWPQKGSVEFRNVSLQYSKDKPPVLKNLCFHIKAREKVGIVGRTGAGKSSIIAALFRMTEPTGNIFIDGIITRDIGLHELRNKISIIPQDPILFTGPLRRNIDPFNEHIEDTLWNVLENVHLKDAVRKLAGGLDAELSEGGSNFSVGQRQLICLARAILRQNKILVLDEATANIDKDTDSFIQKTIREKFDSCTVITVAHRLQTIIDSDRVMVLDSGKIEEFDEPYNLLKKESGVFYDMVQMTGPTMMKELLKVAKETHYKKNNYEIKQLNGICINFQTNFQDISGLKQNGTIKSNENNEKSDEVSHL